VRGRNSDNTLICELLGWEPTTPLTAGMAATYEWIREAMAAEEVAPRV
jgi:nucleoside-diphosphate-sugar epimerase